MKHLCCALLLSSAALASAIDFTPQYDSSVQDGFPVRRLYFQNEKQRVYLAIPKDWSVAGNGQRGVLTPGGLPQASVTLENSPLPANLPFDEKGLEVYRQMAAAMIPSGATEIEMVLERVNELQINGWTSFEVVANFKFFGQSLTKSVLFINMDQGRQIRLRVDARKENFEKLYPKARGALASWFSPSPELEDVLQRMTAKK